MSYLFRGKKKYFDFIESLEKEEEEFRKLNQEYSAKSEMCNHDYKIQAQHVTQTLRRLGAREIRHVNPSRTTKSRTPTSINKSRANSYKNTSQNHSSAPSTNNESFLNTSPARIVSKQWPVRPNSAYRILAPVTKFKKYNEMNEGAYITTKDPPLIHSTGISNSTISNNIKEVSNDNSDQIFNNIEGVNNDNSDHVFNNINGVSNDNADHIFNNTQSPKVNEYGKSYTVVSKYIIYD